MTLAFAERPYQFNGRSGLLEVANIRDYARLPVRAPLCALIGMEGVSPGSYRIDVSVLANDNEGFTLTADSVAVYADGLVEALTWPVVVPLTHARRYHVEVFLNGQFVGNGLLVCRPLENG